MLENAFYVLIHLGQSSRNVSAIETLPTNTKKTMSQSEMD